MIGGLKRYPEYSESGVPWLGRIPAHWDVSPGRAVFAEKQVKNKRLTEKRVLSLSYGRIVVKPVEKLRGLIPESFETYQIVEPGDVIIRATDLQNDHTSLRVGFVRDRGIITSAYLCLKGRGALTREFGYLLLHAYDLMKIFYGLGSGLRQNLSFKDIKYLSIAVPPSEDQEAAARFIRAVDHRTNRIVQAKRRLLALLKEQKQAIIHRAVTRGLDTTGSLKPSGIAWLGDVPERWQLRRLGQIASVSNGTTPSRAQPGYWENGTVPWLASGKVNDFIVSAASEFVTERALNQCALTIVPSGAVILGLVGQGRTRGMSARLAIDACINQNLAAIVPTSHLRADYLHYFLTAHYSTLREYGRGGNQEALNCAIVARLRVPVPPSEEQERVCNYLAATLTDVLRSEDSVKREINLIQEYRTRLIADVVTGQLDVREAARRLPDEVVEFDDAVPIDEEDESDEPLEAVADHE